MIICGLVLYPWPISFVVQIVEVVCCKLTPLQSDLYKHFIQSKNVMSTFDWANIFRKLFILLDIESNKAGEPEKLNPFLETQVKRAITEELKQSKILAYITALKKLCNHPKVWFRSFFQDEGGGVLLLLSIGFLDEIQIVN